SRNESSAKGAAGPVFTLALTRSPGRRDACPTLEPHIHDLIRMIILALVAGVIHAAEPIEPGRVATVIEALSHLGPEKVESNPKLKVALEQVLDATQGTPQFVDLVRDFKIKDRNPVLLEIAAR